MRQPVAVSAAFALRQGPGPPEPSSLWPLGYVTSVLATGHLGQPQPLPSCFLSVRSPMAFHDLPCGTGWQGRGARPTSQLSWSWASPFLTWLAHALRLAHLAYSRVDGGTSYRVNQEVGQGPGDSPQPCRLTQAWGSCPCGLDVGVRGQSGAKLWTAS